MPVQLRSFERKKGLPARDDRFFPPEFDGTLFFGPKGGDPTFVAVCLAHFPGVHVNDPPFPLRLLSHEEAAIDAGLVVAALVRLLAAAEKLRKDA